MNLNSSGSRIDPLLLFFELPELGAFAADLKFHPLEIPNQTKQTAEAEVRLYANNWGKSTML